MMRDDGGMTHDELRNATNEAGTLWRVLHNPLAIPPSPSQQIALFLISKSCNLNPRP